MKNNDNSDLVLLKMVAAKEPDITKVWPKALANYLFREIIEDAHVKYGISQEDMKEMNKKAANRAKAFLDVIVQDPKMFHAFASYAAFVMEWDAPEITEEEEDIIEMLDNMADLL
ncbi:hypothetical protein [Butyrivibrio sp. INlla16]|uniref:hypothetical protein n=1 Tax=Butyrivibrio sp. INlla16 TaxID=1520807 RepID=UPI0008844D58|nr:hypothetical protein [Butyrivibrio sp. INlla16]SDB14098.1 hypothetical protein SAMN02910263_00656 [Butyrivibrio sp. INlla16]